MPSSSFLDLPNELLTKIVQELGADINDLDALALTHRVFTSTCQRELFQTLKLSGRKSQVVWKLKELISLLQGNPSLSGHFGSIHLDKAPTLYYTYTGFGV